MENVTEASRSSSAPIPIPGASASRQTDTKLKTASTTVFEKIGSNAAAVRERRWSQSGASSSPADNLFAGTPVQETVPVGSPQTR